RVLIGLQTVDTFNVALPADWRPGDEVIDPNPGNMKGVEERWEKSQKADSGVKCYDWFFCTREIPCDEIHKKIGK
ncbi:MAG: peroxiredoxin, partial [Tidjanibacter sp.]|nr:peroxiredoxin [Tidjanibacter sp.]